MRLKRLFENATYNRSCLWPVTVTSEVIAGDGQSRARNDRRLLENLSFRWGLTAGLGLPPTEPWLHSEPRTARTDPGSDDSGSGWIHIPFRTGASARFHIPSRRRIRLRGGEPDYLSPHYSRYASSRA